MLLMGAHPMFHKKLLMGQSIWLLQKEKEKSCECTHDLINMNHTNGKATTRPIKQFDQSTTRFRSQP
jgi:hypothetical protein